MSDSPAEPVAEDDAPIVSVVAPLGNLGAVIVKRKNGDGLCAHAPARCRCGASSCAVAATPDEAWPRACRLVEDVTPSSLAWSSGVRVGDVLLTINGKDIRSGQADAAKALRDCTGSDAKLEFMLLSALSARAESDVDNDAKSRRSANVSALHRARKARQARAAKLGAKLRRLSSALATSARRASSVFGAGGRAGGHDEDAINSARLEYEAKVATRRGSVEAGAAIDPSARKIESPEKSAGGKSSATGWFTKSFTPRARAARRAPSPADGA